MIHRENRDGVAVLRMEHGKVSAIDFDLLGELSAALDRASGGRATAVVLTGTGSTFSAGVDLFKVLNGGREYLDRLLPAFTPALRKLFTLQRPIVAAINGHAIPRRSRPL